MNAAVKASRTDPANPVKNRYVQSLAVITTAFVVFLGSQILGVAIISIVGSFIFGATGDSITSALENNITVRFLLTLTIEALTVGLIYRSLKGKRLTFAAIGLTKRPTSRHLIEALKAYGIYFLVFLSVFTIVGTLGIIDTEQAQQLGFDNPTGVGLVLTFISLVILPPIAEEILFRGYLYQRLKVYAPALAAIVTSVLFAVAHLEFGTGSPLNWAAALDTFILSLVLIYLVDRTKSLWPAILLHAIKNAIAFTSLFLLK